MHADITPEDLAAIHRIPERDSTKPRPVDEKFWQKDVRNYVMGKFGNLRKQKKMVPGKIRLVDDVTKDSVMLINKLKEKHLVDSAWYYNGRVYGQRGTVRKQIDLLENVEEVFKI